MLAVPLKEFERLFLVVYRNICDLDWRNMSFSNRSTYYFFIKNKITYHIQVQYEKKTKIKDQRKVEGWDRVSHVESEGSWLELNSGRLQCSWWVTFEVSRCEVIKIGSVILPLCQWPKVGLRVAKITHKKVRRQDKSFRYN